MDRGTNGLSDTCAQWVTNAHALDGAVDRAVDRTNVRTIGGPNHGANILSFQRADGGAFTKPHSSALEIADSGCAYSRRHRGTNGRSNEEVPSSEQRDREWLVQQTLEYAGVQL